MGQRDAAIWNLAALGGTSSSARKPMSHRRLRLFSEKLVDSKRLAFMWRSPLLIGPPGNDRMAFSFHHIRMSCRADKIISEMRTAHRHFVLFEHRSFGKMLMLDGVTQIAPRDEFIYQKMMARVPLFGHGNAREVLIVGSGRCAIAKEVLKHQTVRHLAGVEIDAAVVAFAQMHFPEIAKPVLADTRFQSVIVDGMRPCRRHRAAFDLIIVDSTDPQDRESSIYWKILRRCATARPAAAPPDIGCRRCTPPPSRCRASSPTSWRRRSLKPVPPKLARTADLDEIAAQSAHRGWASRDAANREDVLFVSRKDGL
jgi:hypothetical protein